MLRIESLHASYGRSKILHGVSLEAARGEITCLLGRNGAGKSTTLKCLMGLLPVGAGSVNYQDSAITGLPPHAVARRGIGYVPETRMVFPNLTVAENLSMGFWRRTPDRAAATERVLHYFPRLRDRFSALGGTLSGGEQQMLAIGRALMAAPKFLLIDEPTEGLAPVIVQALEKTFYELAQAGTSILVVESKLAVASRIADRIFVLAKGVSVFSGTPGELAENNAIRREYLEV
jgi:branched-chain amino acid transport system ATP-binding protein